MAKKIKLTNSQLRALFETMDYVRAGGYLVPTENKASYHALVKRGLIVEQQLPFHNGLYTVTGYQPTAAGYQLLTEYSELVKFEAWADELHEELQRFMDDVANPPVARTATREEILETLQEIAADTPTVLTVAPETLPTLTYAELEYQLILAQDLQRIIRDAEAEKPDPLADLKAEYCALYKHCAGNDDECDPGDTEEEIQGGLATLKRLLYWKANNSKVFSYMWLGSTEADAIALARQDGRTEGLPAAGEKPLYLKSEVIMYHGEMEMHPYSAPGTPHITNQRLVYNKTEHYPEAIGLFYHGEGLGSDGIWYSFVEVHFIDKRNEKLNRRQQYGFSQLDTPPKWSLE